VKTETDGTYAVTPSHTACLPSHRPYGSTTRQVSFFLLPLFVGAFLLYAGTEAARAKEALPERSFLRLTSTTICCVAQGVKPDNPASEARKNTAPLTLDQLVDLAINHHPSVSAKRADLDVARAELEVARHAFYPTPAVQLQQGRSSNGPLISLQQPLWTGGRLRAGVDAAGAHTMAADLAIIEAQFALALRVANAYQVWLQAHRRIAVFIASIKQLAVYGERIDRRVQGGTSAEVDRSLVRTRLLQAKSDLTTAKAAEQAALVQLSQTVGHILRSNALHAPKAGITEPAVPALTNLLTDAIERNASLRRIALDIATNQHETEQKRAALWPTIGLRAEHQRSNAVGGNSNSKDNRLFVVLEYTPGAGLSARMQIDAQLARTQSLSESAETAKRDLVERIAIEYQDYFASQSRQQSLQGLLVANRDVLASYDRLFLAGKREWLDVVNAARELMQIEVTDADLSAQQDGALYRLRLLAGEQPWLSRAPASVSVDTPVERLFDAVNQKISQ